MSSFCPGCGSGLSESDTSCAVCGRSVSATAATPAPDPAIAFGLLPETSGTAIFSLVCGVLGMFPPAAIVAVIFGHLSLSEIRRSPGRLAGRGLAIAGIILGYLGVAFLLFLISLGLLSMLRTMRQQRETKSAVTSGDQGASAVSVLRAMNTAEIGYAQAHPAAGYTCSMSDLSGTWGIKDQLRSAKNNAYTFAIQACAANHPGGPITKYRIVAYPMAINQPGKPAFCSNESDVIKVSRNGSIQDCLRVGEEMPAGEINHPKAWSQPTPN